MKRGTEISGSDLQYVRARFRRSDFRDLVILFLFAWCGFTLRDDPEIAALIEKAQDYTHEDKLLILEKSQAVLSQVISINSGVQKSGSIELSCSPYYHPILPLIIDSRVRADTNPAMPDFKYPADARRHLSMAMEKFQGVFGFHPEGMWPSEGSVSQEAVEFIQDAGIRWIAADEALLYEKSTGTVVPDGATNRRPWLIGKEIGQSLTCCFRDRGLSDDIGFQFSWKKPDEAVHQLVTNLENIAKGYDKDGPPALVSLVCDGENPWEHFPDGGEGFLKGLAEALENNKLIKTTTPSEYLKEFPAEKRISKLGSGSWIGGNFDIWNGCQEDRDAWQVLAEVRAKLDEVYPLPADAKDEIGTEERRKVLEHLWVAEGSDWFWWYGEPFHTPLDYVFDTIFRGHIRRAYELMKLDIPVELLVPIDPKLPVDNINVQNPLDVIHPKIDGKNTNFYEWSGSGHLHASDLEGLMAREKPGPISDIFFGSDTENLFLRIDIDWDGIMTGDVLILRVLKPKEINVAVDLFKNPQAELRYYQLDPEAKRYHLETFTSGAVGEIVEMCLPIASLGASQKSTISFAAFIMREKEMVDRCPLFGTISVTVPDDRYIASLWRE
jgi:alpha-amylase/alpha-mannosidase (GH57 family)